MLKLITAQEANWHAKQRTYLNGLLETIIYPKIQNAASFGSYETRVFLQNITNLTPETNIHLIGVLQKNGFIVKIKNQTLFIEWK